jgi:hypothetical protein
MSSPYYTDPKVREEIDIILQICASLYSNLGTLTIFDVKEVSAANQIEDEWLEKIKELDLEFYQKVKPLNLEPVK